MTIPPLNVIEEDWPETVLIFAPIGQDAFLIRRELEAKGILCGISRTADALFERISRDAGALVLAEEVFTVSFVERLNGWLSSQEPWSDLPLVVMTSGGGTTLASMRVLKAFAPAGNVTLLERPFRPITLVSAMHVALRSRRRQYLVRGLLQKQVEATRMRDEFISIASHELKTPLTSLKLQAQLNKRLITSVEAEGLSRERVEKLIDSTDRQVDRLARLVEDMLDISRITTGKLAMERSPVNLAQLVLEVVDRLLSQLEAAGCETHLDVDDGISGCWDRFRIEQVISNLLMNAIRYSAGSPVWIALRKVDGRAVLGVRDEGPGIAKENQERIFQRFERAVNARSITGLGLGLYICREIVEAHGGTIAVKSELGQGALFTVSLPTT